MAWCSSAAPTSPLFAEVGLLLTIARAARAFSPERTRTWEDQERELGHGRRARAIGGLRRHGLDGARRVVGVTHARGDAPFSPRERSAAHG